MKKKLNLQVTSLKQASEDFITAWHLAESGKQGIEEKEVLIFESLSDLLKTLTPKRLEFLKILRNNGATSIRSLSALLNRDYHNVYTDARILSHRGLIQKKEDKLYVPWSELVVSLSLTSKQESFTKSNRNNLKRYWEPHRKAS